MVNPLVEPPDRGVPRRASAALVEAGTEVFDGIGSDIKKEGVVEAAYAGTPLAAVLSLFDGVDDVRADLGQIRCPTLLLLAAGRTTWWTPVSGDVLAASVAGPLERVHLEDSYHVATLDYDAPLIEQRVVDFAVEVMGGAGPVAG